MVLSALKINNSDILGALASGLCLIHCVATPFIFIVQAESSTHHHDAPIWWQSIDFIFIIISLLAVYWSARNTSKNWIKLAFWTSWVFLTIILINEKIMLIHIPGGSIYVPALALVGLHIYNRMYCQCKEDDCCAVTP